MPASGRFILPLVPEQDESQAEGDPASQHDRPGNEHQAIDPPQRDGGAEHQVHPPRHGRVSRVRTTCGTKGVLARTAARVSISSWAVTEIRASCNGGRRTADGEGADLTPAADAG